MKENSGDPGTDSAAAHCNLLLDTEENHMNYFLIEWLVSVFVIGNV